MPFRISPIVLNLLILNGLVFITWQLLGQFVDVINCPEEELAMRIALVQEDSRFFMQKYFLLNKAGLLIDRGLLGELFYPVQIVTSFFSHNEIWHILMNMLALVSFGTALESTIGPKRFLAEYLAYGIGAGIIIAFLDPSGIPVLGASTAISGLLVSFAMRFPDARMMIFPFPFPIKAIYLVGGIAAISAILIISQLTTGDDTIGGNISHFGHFAGMVVAFIYLQGWKKEYWQRNRWR